MRFWNHIPTWLKVWALTSLLVTGIMFLIFRQEYSGANDTWVLSLLAALFLYTWGTINWHMIKGRDKTVSVSVRSFTNEDGVKTVNIDVDNATPEEAKEIYEHIKELNL